MTSHIVVAFRMPHAGMTAGPEGAYLTRARSMCARGEALGARLVAWSAAVFAMAWEPDSLEEALLLAVSLREESGSAEGAWCCGLAEGELEPLSPEGARMQLAWGQALVSAASLARIAHPGELLVDGDVTALRAGQLTLLGSRAATDAGRRVRGWRLDVEHPWKRSAEPAAPAADPTDRFFVVPEADESFTRRSSSDTTQEMAILDFSPDELAAFDILDIVDATSAPDLALPAEVPRRPGSLFAERLRARGLGDGSSGAVESLADLRRAAARAEGGPPAKRCQAVLGLAIALSIVGRPEEALLEALDALARAREAGDPKAVGACRGVLAKLYAAAGFPGEATALRESAGAF